MDDFQEKLGYTFRDPSLLQQSLTHPSRAAERPGCEDNQRLEFLGDAVLQLILTRHLYEILPEKAEGHLTKTRASLVSKPALAGASLRIGVGEHLLLGKGEDANGGRGRESNLADAFEAILGAVYLDGGLPAAETVAMRVLGEDLASVLEGEDTSNPKGRLQEVLQSLHRESPAYRIVSEEGPDHLKKFQAEVTWRGLSLAMGYGSSKKTAEADAAERALEEARWEAAEGK